MRKFHPKTYSADLPEGDNFFQQYSDGAGLETSNKKAIISNALLKISVQDQSIFYPLIGQVFILLGYNAQVTRSGDTNNRSDAYLIDTINSIPIEIKSPTEVPYINIKSIRQALENKIVLLSRKFHPTTKETTSLAIGLDYPADRSEVFDLIEDIKITYGFNIGMISIEDLLSCLWEKEIGKKPFHKERITLLKGQFNENTYVK